MNFIAKINILPKEALLDPQGNAVKKAMNNLNLSSQKVRSNRLNDYVFKFSKIDLAIEDLSNKI